ncbi:serine/threonine protein kinase [Trifolium medium]|uniref:Serine/threonine protein kinase n=1 Tax=Trifolium medium TaxID=97028 RepID=A0A392MVQ5_9FABA|nr:serine/threonine protein kinase [Trifolium medium]
MTKIPFLPLRRTGGNDGGGCGSTMERAIASMQGVGEFGLGKHRKGSAVTTKVSRSSIPDSVIREDPTTKYEILYELGKGSYGAVYKARDYRTSEMFAIKVISLSEGVREIRGEIEMLQQGNHPNFILEANKEKSIFG